MTAEQFVVLQQYMLSAFWPFIRFWIIAFLVGGVMVSILIVFMVITREAISRVS